MLPVTAAANVSIRLAPGQQEAEIAGARSSGCCATPPPTAPSSRSSCCPRRPPGVVPPDARAITLGQDAFERVLGVRPALIRSGGTLPIVAALADRGIATIISGFSLPDANIHSPNERMLAEYVPLGIATSRALFEALASL